ncbi:hypothetical protein LCGC14_1050520 [marine sediment metagenome]|uniref:Uncharacterized protein n=1 Tax=marine sediment metagenome TaxID=412755 RepID=A0A0F9NAT0_9ZZZZ
MALIEVFHVVASNLQIDATSTTVIPQGMLVGLDASTGYVVRAGDTANFAVGIAGDTLSQGTTSYTPESNSGLSRNPEASLEGALITAAWGGGQRFTQNRVADNYNEVLASGKMTVYHSGGEFWSDQYELIQTNGTTVATYTPGTYLYTSEGEAAAAASEPEGQRNGRFTDEAGTGVVGMTFTSPTNYPSGVPGTDTAFASLPEGGNSLTWGTFLHLQLRH